MRSIVLMSENVPIELPEVLGFFDMVLLPDMCIHVRSVLGKFGPSEDYKIIGEIGVLKDVNGDRVANKLSLSSITLVDPSMYKAKFYSQFNADEAVNVTKYLKTLDKAPVQVFLTEGPLLQEYTHQLVYLCPTAELDFRISVYNVKNHNSGNLTTLKKSSKVYQYTYKEFTVILTQYSLNIFMNPELLKEYTSRDYTERVSRRHHPNEEVIDLLTNEMGNLSIITQVFYNTLVALCISCSK